MIKEDMELVQKIRENFVHSRTKQEMAIQTWAENLKKVDPEILKGVELPEEISLRTLMPELYADKPNQAVYHEQYLKACELFATVNKIADAYNQEARKCLSEYQAMNLQQ